MDPSGRLLYVGWPVVRATEEYQEPTATDSVPLLRADFEQRRIDTLGFVARPLQKLWAPPNANGMALNGWTVDQLRTLDEWAVLADGSVAFVRGHDYHVDIVPPNGTAITSPKLPFDWRLRTDDEKQRLQDSTRAQLTELIQNYRTIAPQVDLVRLFQREIPGGKPANDAPSAMTAFLGYHPQLADPFSLDELPGYYPPIRLGAAMADLDGNLWVLPSTSKQSLQGELVYDMINAKGELVRRVRAPVGRLIVGFGRNGTVYMATGTRIGGFYLEKTKLPVSRS
jgi:hypothetical protein